MKIVVLVTALVAAVAVLPAAAEHGPGTADEQRLGSERATSTDLDLQLELGLGGVRLGGRVFGRDGVAGAWLNGRLGPDGFAVDGRVEREDGSAWNFTLDAEAMDEAAKLAWQWLRGRILPMSEGRPTL
jgi:hypothetical protein